MPGFQNALTPSVDPEGNPLSQTQGMDMAQAPASPDTGVDMGSYDTAIKQAHENLNGILSQLPNIDFAGKYKELVGQVQNRPVPEAPNPLTSFAFAFGAPKTAPSLLHEKVLRQQQVADQKEMDLMQLKEHLIQGAIQQEIAQGNFKAALSQSKLLSELQLAINNRERALNMQDAIKMQTVKTANARSLITDRVRQLVAQFHLQEKDQINMTTQMTDLVQALLGQKDFAGRPVHTVESAVAFATQVMEQTHGTASNLSRNKPLPDTTQPAPKGQTPKERAAAALREVRESKVGK